MNTVLREVLEEIKPTRKEERELREKTEEFLRRLERGLKHAKAELGGSGAKGTWLKGQHDADIFVRYDYERYKDDSFIISENLEKVLRRSFRKIRKLHGSRDYFQIVTGRDFTFEIVPILAIKRASQAENITDISPLHARWVNRHRKLRNEIRLAKAFAKANNAYGAESYINGFSGYVMEILTIYYGSFRNLIRNAAKWKEKQVIDIEKHHRNVWLEVNKSKLEGPLVVIDPVQPGRNASAALSPEKFNNFVNASKKFIKKPSKELFKRKEITEEALKKKGNKLIMIRAKPKNGKIDIAGSRLLKVSEFLGKRLEEFDIKEKGWEWDRKKEAMLWYILKKEKLPEYYEWAGPPIERKEHVKIFSKKYRKTYKKKGRIYAKVKRKVTKADDAARKALKEPYIKERVKEIRIG